MLLFQFDVTDRGVTLGLYVGPGPEAERTRLLGIAERWGPPFDLSLRRSSAGTRRWRSIYGYEFVGPDDFVDLDLSVVQQRLREGWNHFLAAELPRVLQPFDEDGQERGGQSDAHTD